MTKKVGLVAAAARVQWFVYPRGLLVGTKYPDPAARAKIESRIWKALLEELTCNRCKQHGNLWFYRFGMTDPLVRHYDRLADRILAMDQMETVCTYCTERDKTEGGI